MTPCSLVDGHKRIAGPYCCHHHTVEYSTLWRHEVCSKRLYLSTKLHGVIFICWRLINSIAVWAQWRRHHGAARRVITSGQDSCACAPRIYSSGGVGLFGTVLPNELLPCVWSISGMIIDGKAEVLRETLVLLAFRKLNLLLGLSWD